MPKTLDDPDREHAAQLIALFSVLVYAWKTHDFAEADRATRELTDLGVRVRVLGGRRPSTAEAAR